jgi:hypothetical protein
VLQQAVIQLKNSAGYILDNEYGYGAMHHGLSPHQWVKPGGQQDPKYRFSTCSMISSIDVLET